MSIANRINEITKHLENDYINIEALVGEVSEDKNIENIAPILDTLWEGLPKVTGEDTSLNLNNTKKGKTKLTLKGNTYQETTTGKNLFNKDSGFELGYIRASDGVFISENVSCIFNQYVPVIANEKYKLTANTNLRNIALVYYDSTKTYISKEQASNTSTGTFTIPANVSFAVFGFSYNATTTITQDIIDELNIQLEQGTTATEYEKYTGGMASPNPDYPQEIEVVTGLNEVKVEGKNLCNGINQSVYLNQVVNICGVLSGNSGLYIPVNGGEYTISTTTTQTRYRVACSMVVPQDHPSTTEVYNGVNKDGTNDSITINTTGYNYLIVNATDITAIQVEKGSTATTYEAYKGQTYEVNLGSIELCKIGTYKDQIYKSLVDNNWYVHKEIGKVVLDGTNNAFDSKSGQSGNTYVYNATNFIPGPALTDTPLFIADKFIPKSWNDRDNYLDSTIMFIYSSVTNLLFRFGTSSNITTLELANTWLTNNNVTLYGILATPTETQITDTTLVNQLEAVWRANSYDNQTNVSQTNSSLPFIISASALEKLSS